MNKKLAKLLIKYARESIKAELNKTAYKPKSIPEEFKVKRGVFVTLHKHPSHALRGCIGFPEPVQALWKAVISAAKSSAFADPRFKPLMKDELSRVIIEVSILSKPELISVKDPRDYAEVITPGKDGLILRYGVNAGLFLPQVWDQLPTPKEFLDELCLKAGLPMGSWLNPDVRLYRFSVDAWSEDKPNGNVVTLLSD